MIYGIRTITRAHETRNTARFLVARFCWPHWCWAPASQVGFGIHLSSAETVGLLGGSKALRVPEVFFQVFGWFRGWVSI